MLNLSFYIAISLIYIAILFAIALWGDKKPVKGRMHPWVYSLSLTIFCTSWTFYGATAQFAQNGWFFSPVHLGTIVLFIVGFAFWQKMIRVAKQENVTTISDFIASRYGHSREVSIIAALICLIVDSLCGAAAEGSLGQLQHCFSCQCINRSLVQRYCAVHCNCHGGFCHSVRHAPY